MEEHFVMNMLLKMSAWQKYFTIFFWSLQDVQVWGKQLQNVLFNISEPLAMSNEGHVIPGISVALNLCSGSC